MMGYIAVGLICLWFGYHVGWRNAHLTVAKECERLGKFFVGKTVYECTKIVAAHKEPTSSNDN